MSNRAMALAPTLADVRSFLHLPADPTDILIETLVHCREIGMTQADSQAIVTDVYAAPWDERS